MTVAPKAKPAYSVMRRLGERARRCKRLKAERRAVREHKQAKRRTR